MGFHSLSVFFGQAAIYSLAFFLLATSRPAAAQTDGRRDPDFRPVFRTAAEIYYAFPQADEGLLVVGNFDRLLGQPRRTLARLRADGSLDPVFAPSLRRDVFAAVGQSDGRVVCAERTSDYRILLFRLAADGSLDSSFVGPGVYPSPFTAQVLARAAGDRLILAQQDESGFQGMIRLLPDGRVDPSFSIAPKASAGRIEGARVRPDGSILVWGSFTGFGGATARGMVLLRPDGTLDPTFTAQQDTSLRIERVELAADGGALLLAASTSSLDAPHQLVRLTATGAIATNFSAGDRGEIYALAWAERPGGTRLVLGSRPGYPAAPGVFRVVELRADGSTERDFSYAPTSNDAGSFLALMPNGTTYFLGSGPSATSGTRLLRLPAGAADAQAIADPPGELDATSIGGLAAAPDGRLLVWGSFYHVDGIAAPNGVIVRNVDGTWDAAATAGLNQGGDDINDAVALGAGGWLITWKYGDFEGKGAFLRLDATGNVDPAWVATARSCGLTYVWAVAAESGGGALILGNVDGPATALKVIRVRPDGSLDGTFSCDVTAAAPGANALTVRPDGRFYVGHRNIGSYLGSSSSKLLRRMPDGQTDPSFTPAANTPEHASFVARTDGGVTLLLADAYSPTDGYRLPVRRLRADGSLDAASVSRVRYGGETLRSTALRDGRILVDGSFHSIGERSRAGLARLTADGELDASFRPELPTGPVQFVEDLVTPVGGLTPVLGPIGAKSLVEMPEGSLFVAPRAGSDPLVRLLAAGRPPVPGRGRGQLVNVSSRGRVEAGDRAMIAGFVVSGGTRRVVVRALGPSLAGAGVPGTLENPTLDIFSGGTLIGSNDDWAAGPSANAIIAAGLAPASVREAAAALTLAPGPYTAVVRGAGEGTGVALVEVYVLDAPTYDSAPPPPGAPRAANLSTRAFVGTGDNMLIGGFAIRGGSARVALRGLGPTLSRAGVSGTLLDPYIRVVRQEDGWQLLSADSPSPDDTSPLVLPTPTSTEVAVVGDLPEGNYTVIVSGVNAGTGIGMFEVYELPDNGAP